MKPRNIKKQTIEANIKATSRKKLYTLINTEHGINGNIISKLHE